MQLVVIRKFMFYCSAYFTWPLACHVMRLLNMKRMKTETEQRTVYRILVTYAFYWSGTVGHSRETRRECRRKKLRRIFRSNCLRPKHNLIIVAWLFVAKTCLKSEVRYGTDLHQYWELRTIQWLFFNWWLKTENKSKNWDTNINNIIGYVRRWDNQYMT